MLTQDQKNFFRENGYLAVEDLFSPEHISRLVRRTEEICANWQNEVQRLQIGHEPGTEEMHSSETIRKMSYLAGAEKIFQEHASHPGFTALVADLIGRPVDLYLDQMQLKPPRCGTEKPPHQDNAYFRISPPDAVITCWTALDDATEENGCMHYFPGSHLRGLVSHEAIPDTPHLVPPNLDLNQSVGVPMRAGGCAFHHSQTLHHSYSNQSDRWRRAYICHFVQRDADISKGSQSKPMMPVLD